jgi:hypothetical protein
LEKAINVEKLNDLPTFLSDHTSIQIIVFNGRKAEMLATSKKAKEMWGDILDNYETHCLPSTSPANTSKLKITKWKKVLRTVFV